MKSTKKIVIMYDFFSENGGLEKVMLFQGKTLKNKGYNVTFAFAFVDDKLKKEKLSEFKVIEYGKLPIKAETIQISTSLFRKKILNKFKGTDLIICHSFPASYLAYKLKQKFNIPYILHIHHPPKFLYEADLKWAMNDIKRIFAYFVVKKILKKPFRRLDKLCVKNASSHFVASRSVQKRIKDIYGVDGKVIYAPVSNQFKTINIKHSELAKINNKIQQDFILSSGRVVKQKKLDWLIITLSKIKNKELQLVIAGEYESKIRNELESLSKQHKVSILFLGKLKQEDLVKLYNCAKVVISICPKEGFGLSLAEAIACGTPAISWKDGSGPEEIIIEGKNGYLAKPYYINDLAEKIANAVNKKWGKKMLSKSVEKFKEEEIENVLLTMFADIKES